MNIKSRIINVLLSEPINNHYFAIFTRLYEYKDHSTILACSYRININGKFRLIRLTKNHESILVNPSTQLILNQLKG
jgi:hypothetical protein